MNNSKYYSMEKVGKTLELYIFGDITSYPFFENDVSEDLIVKELKSHLDVDQINVHISSYGGEVKTGIAIYNTLKNHKAKVKTICDGFACSIASVIFMAGDERVMNELSMLMIHDAWSYVCGNANQIRKEADDLEKITQLSVMAYEANSTLSKEDIEALMKAESWISPDEALEYGFATAIEKGKSAKANQSAKMHLIDIIKAHQKAKNAEEDPEEEPEDDEDDSSEDKPTDDESEGEEDDSEENPAASEEEEDDESDEKPDTSTEKSNQYLIGIFNAILKM